MSRLKQGQKYVEFLFQILPDDEGTQIVNCTSRVENCPQHPSRPFYGLQMCAPPPDRKSEAGNIKDAIGGLGLMASGEDSKPGDKRCWREWRIPEERKSSSDRGIRRGGAGRRLWWHGHLEACKPVAESGGRGAVRHFFTSLPSPPPSPLDSV